MLRWALTLGGLIALAGPLSGEVRITGETKVPRDRMVRLGVEGATDAASFMWDVAPEELADIEEHVDGRLLFTGPPGTYRVKVRAQWIKEGKIITQTARATVVIEESGPTPPVPPPPVDDPLLAPVRTAFQQETSATRVADMLELAAIWRSAASDDYLKKAGTWKNLLSDLHGATEIRIKDRLKAVRATLAAETKRLVPDLSVNLANGESKKAGALLLRFARVLETVASGRKTR
jgi:hypothetical protein